MERKRGSEDVSAEKLLKWGDKMGDLSMSMVQYLKEKYPVGMNVVCDYMDDSHGVPSGTRGVVSCVDDVGTIHVKWENGSGLGLVYGSDSFHVVNG